LLFEDLQIENTQRQHLKQKLRLIETFSYYKYREQLDIFKI